MHTHRRRQTLDRAFARLEQIATDPEVPAETARRALVNLISLIRDEPDASESQPSESPSQLTDSDPETSSPTDLAPFNPDGTALREKLALLGIPIGGSRPAKPPSRFKKRRKP